MSFSSDPIDPAESRHLLRERIPACRACAGDKGNVTLPTPRFGLGPLHRPRLMIVGQNPPVDPARCLHGGWMLHYGDAAHEKVKGTHEQLVYELVSRLDLLPSEVYVTQAIKCPTIANSTPQLACRLRCPMTYLQFEVRDIQPQAILALGSVAQMAVEDVFRHRTSGKGDPRPCGEQIMAWQCHTRDGVKVAYPVVNHAHIVDAPHPSVVHRFITKDSWFRAIGDALTFAWRNTPLEFRGSAESHRPFPEFDRYSLP